METVIVVLIVLAAVLFTVRRFIKIYKGESGCSGGCECSSACHASSSASCCQDFPISPEK